MAGDLQKPPLRAWFLLAVALTTPRPAIAWGDEGHKVIALIAEHYLDPAVRAKVAGLLAPNTDTLTDHDISSEATWADKYRDSDRDTTKIRYEATWRWHFVDVELAQPDLASACFDHPPLPAGVPASQGPPRACVVDKIDQFTAELSNPATGASERLLALKFLLHFVGDLHQPLHAADDHDAGGNKKLVAAPKLGQNRIALDDAHTWQSAERKTDLVDLRPRRHLQQKGRDPIQTRIGQAGLTVDMVTACAPGDFCSCRVVAGILGIELPVGPDALADVAEDRHRPLEQAAQLRQHRRAEIVFGRLDIIRERAEQRTVDRGDPQLAQAVRGHLEARVEAALAADAAAERY
jgi:hypothetical protein